MSEEAQAIGEAVRAARKKKGWSQDRLAEEAGLSRPSIARIERGDDVSTATLRNIAEVFGLTLGLVEPPDISEHQ